MRPRWYDPSTGEFLSVDPDFSQTLDAYGYADDNPTDGNDWLGLSSQSTPPPSAFGYPDGSEPTLDIANGGQLWLQNYDVAHHINYSSAQWWSFFTRWTEANNARKVYLTWMGYFNESQNGTISPEAYAGDMYGLSYPSGAHGLVGGLAIVGSLLVGRLLGDLAGALLDETANEAVDSVLSELGSAVGPSGGLIDTGNVFIYTSTSAAGDADYVGITSNIARRAGEHFASKGINIDPIWNGAGPYGVDAFPASAKW